MKQQYGLLICLAAVVESRTWRPTPHAHAPTTPFSSTLSLGVPRGGSKDIPTTSETGNSLTPLQVPDFSASAQPQDPTNSVSSLQQSVAHRGGSTTTRNFPTPNGGSLTVQQPTATGTAPLTTPKVTSNTNNSNATLTAAKSAVSKPIKHHKRHKHIAKKLKNRNAVNFGRKFMHASFGFFFAALNHFIPKSKFVPGMTILTSATLVMELLRYRKGFGWMNDILHAILGGSLRKHEMDGKFTGSFYYFLGVTLTAAMYPTSCATMGIFQLAIADPTASYFGRATRHVYWSRIENGLGGFGRNKGILGFLGGGLACVPMNYRLLSIARFGQPVSTTSIWVASFALGLAGAFADLAVPTPTLTLPKRVCGVRVPPFHVDDNFVVPIFSAFACTKVFAMLKFPAELTMAKYLIAP